MIFRNVTMSSGQLNISHGFKSKWRLYCQELVGPRVWKITRYTSLYPRQTESNAG